MTSPKKALFIALAAIVALPADALAKGPARGGPKKSIRPPGTSPFRFSHAAYRPRVAVKNIRQGGGLILVDIAFSVPRGHVERVDLLLDGAVVAAVPIPGSHKRGSLTAKLAVAEIARGDHELVAHAHQGRPGRQSIKGISKAVAFRR